MVVSLGQAGANRGAAGIGVLDDHTRGLLKGLHALPRRIGIGDVVVRQGLALQLRVGAEAALRGVEVAVKSRILVRIFSVAQRLRQIKLQVKPRREQRALSGGVERRQVIADRAIIGRGVRKRFPRQKEARLGAYRTACRRHFAQQGGVVRRVGHDRDMLIVLGRAPHHRRPADIDILDGLGQRAVRLRHSLAERVQVDHHQVDGRNARILHCAHVRGKIAPRQNAGVDPRMQGLHAPVQHLRKPGVLADLGDFESRIPEQLGRAAGRDQRHAEILQPARKLDDAGLVGYADQRLFDDGHDQRSVNSE